MKKFISLFLSLVILLSITSGLTFNVYATTPTTGKCGENATWKFDEETNNLIISGTGSLIYDKSMDVFRRQDVYDSASGHWISGKFPYKINDLIIEDGITEIPLIYNYPYVFGGMYIKNFYIPKTITNLSNDFNLNSTIEAYYVDESNPNYMSNDKVIYSKDQTELFAYPDNYKQEQFYVPYGIKRIWINAFSNAKINTLFIPETVEDMNYCIKGENGKYSFFSSYYINYVVDENNNNFSSVDGVLFNKDKKVLLCYPPCKIYDKYNIPDGVETINLSAFSIVDNDKLKEIRLPKSIVNINCQSRLFYNLTFYYAGTEDEWENVEVEYFSNDSPPLNVIFNYSDLLVPTTDKDGNYVGKYGENIIWKYNSSSKTLTLSGTGAVDSFSDDDDFSYSERPWKEYFDDIENIKIEEGITSIGDYTFKNLGEINNIDLPKSLVSIGKSTFEECRFNQVSYNGTNAEFYKIKNIENNKELIIGKFNPILNELLSKPIEVEYKQSEYLELTDEYLTKKVTDIINNNENTIKNNINVKNGYLYINNISIGKVEIGYDYYPFKSEYENENEYIKTNIKRLHDIYLDVLDNDDNTLATFSTQLKFLNDSDYNKSDEQYVSDFVKNLNITKPYYYEVEYDEYIKEFLKVDKSQNMKSFWNYGFKTASKYYNKQISDDLIKFTTGAGSGGTEGSLNLGFYETQHLAIFKNDILYNVYIPEPKYEYAQLLIPVIILPDGLPDDQIENYIMQKIKDDWQNNDIYDIIKGAKNEIEIENGYTLKSANNRDSIVIARRSDSYVPSSPTPGGSTGGGGGGFVPAPAPEETDKKDDDKKPETKPSETTPAPSTAKKPATVVASKPQAKEEAVVVTWKPAKDVDGYEIQVATDKKFKKNKKSAIINKKNAKKKTIKNLKKNKKYFVRVRAYKIVDGKKVYGKWSKVKSVKTK